MVAARLLYRRTTAGTRNRPAADSLESACGRAHRYTPLPSLPTVTLCYATLRSVTLKILQISLHHPEPETAKRPKTSNRLQPNDSDEQQNVHPLILNHFRRPRSANRSPVGVQASACPPS